MIKVEQAYEVFKTKLLDLEKRRDKLLAEADREALVLIADFTAVVKKRKGKA